ncbi:hypothetical protein SAMN05421820_103269 [Pedobacter steynii]|uniref:DUF962 domain-containing protein n=1 Tax=Pedobacter steynii TaxID=430522 RepID=A0A1G9RJF5_9SPHI|nr:DUF962 domain-containing protein [Pedobacter steynii]NQX37733.1 DUF962 domain-containing protein [Pedobacter steynii]SDM23459.1 hypothetical protein SAMN05421820_103269 [Pedobacter steynii]
MTEKKFKTLKEFYPFYLTEHRNLTSRVLHFIGTGLVVLSVFTGILFHEWRFILATPFLGYGFAWVGHFFFEKNKPATFQYPLFSLTSDFLLFWDLLTGNQSFKAK